MSPGRTVPRELLESDNLPSLPAVAVEVLQLCRQDDTTLDDLAEAITRDPALSVKLLRYSNSSLFNLGAEVTTLQRATLVLGMKSVQLMSLSFSLVSNLPRDGQGFDYDTFWRRSLAQAVAARLLTSLSGRPGEDEAFVCGLLANLGQLIMAEGEERYAEVLAASGERWPDSEDEAEVLGYHRGDVAREVLSSWSLPDVINLGVGHMHNLDELPEETPEALAGVVEVLSVARLAVEVLCGESGAALAELERRAAERFSLSEDHVRAYLLALEGAFRETSELLDLPMPTERSHEEIVAEARATMLEVGLSATDELRAQAAANVKHRTEIPADPEFADELTGLLSVDGFNEYLQAEIHARTQSTLTHACGLLLVAIDGYDELAAESAELDLETQRFVASVLQRMTRRHDVPVRLSDGRFAVLAPECSAFGLRTLGDRIRVGIMKQTVSSESVGSDLSVRIGGACIGRANRASDRDALIAVAERYLDRAGARGGNAVIVHPTVIHSDAQAA